jgi:hypothetical protein
MSPVANPNNDKHPGDVRPYLCMPYWIKPLVPGGRWDDGEIRPLPAAPDVISYMCGAVHPGPYVPGRSNGWIREPEILSCNHRGGTAESYRARVLNYSHHDRDHSRRRSGPRLSGRLRFTPARQSGQCVRSSRRSALGTAQPHGCRRCWTDNDLFCGGKSVY